MSEPVRSSGQQGRYGAVELVDEHVEGAGEVSGGVLPEAYSPGARRR
ncbi:hypothetical protein ABT381_04550 [Streptomyces sp. NPDC000151]